MSTLLVLKPAEDFALSITADAVKLKSDAIASLEAISSVNSAEELQKAAQALSSAAGVVKAMEEARVAVKAPVLSAGKRIDAMATEYKDPVEAKIAVVRKMVSDHHSREAAKIEAARKADEARQAELERIRLAEEARLERERQVELKAEADRAEAQRKADLAEQAKLAKKQDDAMSKLRLASAQAEAEEREAMRLAAAAEQEKAHQARMAQLEADRISEASKLAMVPSAPAKVSGIASRKVWKYTISSSSLAYAEHPEFFTLVESKAGINAAIANGLRECPGLHIFEETVTSVRAS